MHEAETNHPSDPEHLYSVLLDIAENILREGGFTVKTAPKVMGADRPDRKSQSKDRGDKKPRQPSEALCPFYREGLKDCPIKDCRRKHEGRTGQVCKSEDYQRYGFCNQIGKCKDMHPWPESRGNRGEKLKEYQQLQKDKQGTGSKIVAAVHRSPVRLSPLSGRTSPSWTDAGPPVLNTSSPAISMIMVPATPSSGRESPEVNLENIVEGNRVRQAPAITEIDRQRLETLLEDLDLDERYAALEDEDLADTQIESEEEPDSAYMLTSVTSMASRLSFITCSPQDESWHPDTGTESSNEE